MRRFQLMTNQVWQEYQNNFQGSDTWSFSMEFGFSRSKEQQGHRLKYFDSKEYKDVAVYCVNHKECCSGFYETLAKIGYYHGTDTYNHENDKLVSLLTRALDTEKAILIELPSIYHSGLLSPKNSKPIANNSTTNSPQRIGYDDPFSFTQKLKEEELILFGQDKIVTAYLITSYNFAVSSINAFEFGDHSALYIHVQGDEPFLYDPNGSYLSGMRGSGGFFVDQEAKLDSYIHYQNEVSARVIKTKITLDKQKALNVIMKAMELGESGWALYCAINVSDVLSSEYGNEGNTFLPDNLRKEIEAIELIRSKTQQ